MFSKHLDFSVNISRYILCYRCPLSTVPEFLGISLSYKHMSFDNLCLTEILRNCPRPPLLDKITCHRPDQGEKQSCGQSGEKRPAQSPSMPCRPAWSWDSSFLQLIQAFPLSVSNIWADGEQPCSRGHKLTK